MSTAINTAGRSTGFDLTQLHVVRPVFWCALICGLALLVVFAGLPGRPLILHTLQKLSHPCVFGLIALSTLVLQSQRSQSRTGAASQYLIALLTAVLIGALTEAAQTLTHRDPAWRDVSLDFRGALCALAFAAASDSRAHSGLFGLRLRRTYLLLGIALLALILSPLSVTLAGYANRSARFPVLFTAEHSIDLLLVSTAGVPTTRTMVPATYSQHPNEWAVPIPFNVHTLAGVSLDEPSPDWHHYQKIVIDATNPNPVAINLILRIHDRASSAEDDDRFSTRLSLPAQNRAQYVFDLDTVRHGPTKRLLDLTQISGLTLTRADTVNAREFLLNRVELQ
jgi:hypothetical protein